MKKCDFDRCHEMTRWKILRNMYGVTIDTFNTAPIGMFWASWSFAGGNSGLYFILRDNEGGIAMMQYRALYCPFAVLIVTNSLLVWSMCSTGSDRRWKTRSDPVQLRWSMIRPILIIHTTWHPLSTTSLYTALGKVMDPGKIESCWAPLVALASFKKLTPNNILIFTLFYISIQNHTWFHDPQKVQSGDLVRFATKNRSYGDVQGLSDINEPYNGV